MKLWLPRRHLELSLALLAHGLLLWAALQARGRLFPPTETAPLPIYVLPINLPPEMTPPAPRTATQPALRRRAAVVAEPITLPVPPRNTVPIQSETEPAIDWQQTMQQVAQSLAAAEAAGTENRLDSRPEVLQLPEKRNAPPKRGDSQILPGGTVRVWMNDSGLYCDFKPPSLMNQFEPWARSIPPSCRQPRNRGITPDLEALQPKYRRGPLPEPP